MASTSKASLGVSGIQQQSILIPEDALLPDPLGDRQCDFVARPPNKRLDINRLYTEDGKIDYDLVKAYQLAQGQLSKEAFMAVVQAAKEQLSREANVIRVKGRVVMFGDIHGQYYDLCEILRRQRFGETSKKFLFLGDYVDRGKYGPEVVALLCALKVRFPH